MDWLEKIDGDLFDIAHRLKEIDGRYELYRNRKSGRFEIYANGALQIAVPYARLDARTVELAASTRAEYAHKLLARIEDDNARLRRDAEKAAREKIMEKAENAL